MTNPFEHKLSPNDKKAQQQIFLLSAILILVGLFLNLGVQPIFLEEPRRSFISFEMLYFENLWVPRELGEYYYKKPPVFNWMLLLSTYFLGWTEFALRLPTVLSTIGISLICYYLGKRYVSKEFGQINAFLFIFAGGILFYFSILAEIDLFYSFVTFASISCLFHFYQTKQWYLLFITCYTLGAIGTLTKGFPSLLFQAFSVGGYLLYKRDLKRLLTLPHLVGLIIFFTLVLGFMYIYTSYHPFEGMVAGTWQQSSERTVLEQDKFKLIKHIFIFPFDILKDTLPSALLVFFIIRKRIWRLLKDNELIAFAVIIFLVNIPVYWVSPGTRQRYIYMLYPFLFMAFSYAYLKTRHLKDWRFKVFRILTGVLLGALTLAMIGLNFVPDLDFLSYRLVLSVIAFFAMGAVFYIYLKRPGLTLSTLILATALTRIMFDLTVIPQRAHDSSAQRDKVLAAEIN